MPSNRRLITDIETTLHQSEGKAAEAITIVKAHYVGHNLWGQGGVCAMAMREGGDHLLNLHHGSGGWSLGLQLEEVEATCVAHALHL